MAASATTSWAFAIGSIGVMRGWLDSPKGKGIMRRHDSKLNIKLIFFKYKKAIKSFSKYLSDANSIIIVLWYQNDVKRVQMLKN